MYQLDNHDVEIKTLFEKLSVEIPGTTGLRAMNLSAFELGVNSMMNKAFIEGSQQTLETAENVIDEVFNRLK